MDQEVNENVAANALRLADVGADAAPQDEADRRQEETEAVNGPRATGRPGYLASSHARTEESEDANFPVVETAPQRMRELAHIVCLHILKHAHTTSLKLPLRRADN